MIEERLTSLETKVDALTAAQAELRTEVSELKGEMRSEFTAVRAEMAGQSAALRAELRTSHDELRRHMGVLHEQLRAGIRDLAPDFGPIRREFQAADAELRKDVDLLKLAIAKRPRQRP